MTPRIAALRAQLIREFEGFLTTLFPNCNDILVRFDPNVDGPEWGSIQALHALFVNYTLSIGPAGPAIRRWVDQHIDLLTEARITSVGLGTLLNGYCETGVSPPR